MSQGPSLVGRAVVAVLLTIGFYALALGIAGGLGAAVYASFGKGHHVNGRLVLFAIIAIGIILWSVSPRIDRFPDPGVRLSPQAQPELHQLVQDVAARTQQAPPVEVFLVGDVNAFVTQRGGMLGIGSRRVMGIGLPLLAVLNVSELRGVLAHEFGHFHGGDTRLGPWIHKTRAAIGRVIANFAKADSLLRLPFQWYGNLFLRITHSISRQQELAADALSVRIVGLLPVQSALRTVAQVAPLFQHYIDDEFLPALNAQVVPPLAAGFDSFLASPAVQKFGAEVAEQAMQRQRNPYDTHPPLPERLAAAARVGGAAVDGEDRRRGTALLRDLPQLERQLLTFQTGHAEIGGFRSIGWDDVGREVLVPMWARTMREHGKLVPNVALAQLPEQMASLRDLALRLDDRMPEEQQDRAGAWLLGVALAHALQRAGFAAENLPGQPVRLRRGEHCIAPFELLHQLRRDAAAAAAWRQQCDAAGIAQLPLVAADAAPETRPA